MKKLFILLIFLCPAILGSFTKPGNYLPGNSGKWETYKTKEYSIQYPSDWQINDSGLMGSSFVLFPNENVPEAKFRNNINLMVQDISAYDIDLDQFSEVSKGQIENLIPNSNILESEKVNGRSPYYKMVYTGDQGEHNLKWKQYYWIKNKKAYILTFTAAQSSYDAGIDIADKILNSFSIK